MLRRRKGGRHKSSSVKRNWTHSSCKLGLWHLIQNLSVQIFWELPPITIFSHCSWHMGIMFVGNIYSIRFSSFFQLLCSADALCPSKKLQEFSFFLLVVDTHSIRKLPKMSHLNRERSEQLSFCFTLLYLDAVFNLPPLLVNNQTNIAI